MRPVTRGDSRRGGLRDDVRVEGARNRLPLREAAIEAHRLPPLVHRAGPLVEDDVLTTGGRGDGRGEARTDRWG